jgi:PIN domain
MASEPSKQAETKKLCVVVDTNVWRSELLLKSHLGAALVYLLGRSGALIGLPEVVEREIKKHIVKAGEEATKEIAKGFRTLEVLLGSRPGYTLPSAAELEQAIERRLEEMKRFLKRIPFTIEHAKAALEMVDQELPPNGPKQQQFKDSAIWQAVLDLSRDYDVVFITSDKAFFRNREPKNGVADNLLADCQRVGGKVDVYGELRGCLEALQKEAPPLDHGKLAKTINDHLHNSLEASTAQRGFALGQIVGSTISAFATEKVDIIALAFDLTYAISDVAQTGESQRSKATVRVSGDCSYNEASQAIDDLRIGTENFEWTDVDGKPSGSLIVYGTAAMVAFGVPTVYYKVRHPVL